MDRASASNALASIRAGTELDRGDYDALRAEMRRYLAAAWPNVADGEAYDTVDEVLTRLVERRAQLEDHAQLQIGYVMRMVRNLQIDRFRSRREVPDQPFIDEQEDSVDDVEILTLLHRDASLSSVRSALASVRSTGDSMIVRVITTWLDIADEVSATPSARAVGKRLGISHSTVGECIDRFTRLLQRDDVSD